MIETSDVKSSRMASSGVSEVTETIFEYVAVSPDCGACEGGAMSM